jgi:NADPH2:quinone reductase
MVSMTKALAALSNPGVSAWLSLAFRAELAPGENVLILGATGITGKLAVKIAKLLGAGQVVAAGRNQQVLGTLLPPGSSVWTRNAISKAAGW